MPLFEYACTTCNHQFEWLSRASETPECPSCHGTTLERRHSTFAARAASATSGATSAFAEASADKQMPMGPCGSCGDPRGPGACSMN